MSTPTTQRVDLTDRQIRALADATGLRAEQIVAVYEGVLVRVPVFDGAEARQEAPTTTVEVVTRTSGGSVRATRFRADSVAALLAAARASRRTSAERVA